MSEQAAISRAESEGRVARVIERDGQSLPVPMDLIKGRLSLTIEKGKMSRVDVEMIDRHWPAHALYLASLHHIWCSDARYNACAGQCRSIISTSTRDILPFSIVKLNRPLIKSIGTGNDWPSRSITLATRPSLSARLIAACSLIPI